VQIAEQEILIAVRNLFIVVQLKKNVIVASQLYDAADVQLKVK